MLKDRKNLNTLMQSLLFVVGFFWYISLYHVPITLNIVSLKFLPPLSTAFMRYQSFDRPFKRMKYYWRSSEYISNSLKDAAVIAEDDRFFGHPGLDWKAIKLAAKKNWERKRFDFGASTITMQLAKNLYLYPMKDPTRKIREGILAIILDAYLSKERILELYLNVVQFGPGIYGAEAAARYYFGGSAKNLNASQSAFLASILPNPVTNGQQGYHLNKRAQSILRRIK